MFFRKVFKYGALGAIATGAYYSFKDGKLDPASIGVVRFGRAAFTIGQIAWDYKTRPKMEDEKDDLKLLSEVNTRSAHRLLNMCQSNGGVFIKVGQHVSALDYLVPPEYTKVLKVLQNQVKRENLSDIKKIIRHELKHDPEDLFKEFDETPIGVASLAQVHRARLHSGEEVAVKLQHPEVDSHSRVDIITMEVLVKLVAWLFPEFQFLWLAEEMKKNLPLELDFINEGRNADRVRKKFSYLPWLKIPKIYWDISTPKLLIMEYCHGGYITDTEYLDSHHISRSKVSNLLGELYSKMIFVEGYIHCDPHPGNLLVHKKGANLELILLDHGLYTTLTDNFRLQYCLLWINLLRRDHEGIRHSAESMGVGELYNLFASILTARSWTSITRGIDRCTQTWEETEEIRLAALSYFYEISTILNRIPREMLLVLKTNDLLRNVEKILGTQNSASSFSLMFRTCVYAIHLDEMKKCSNIFCQARVILKHFFIQLTITFYQIINYLICKFPMLSISS